MFEKKSEQLSLPPHASSNFPEGTAVTSLMLVFVISLSPYLCFYVKYIQFSKNTHTFLHINGII